MQRHLIVTNDGSQSISVPDLHVAYHSIHGAITESLHVFIDAGWKHILKKFPGQSINILEMGLGTGLNVLLSLVEAEKSSILTTYEAIELFPLLPEEFNGLDYPSRIASDKHHLFVRIHSSPWEEEVKLTDYFILTKRKCSLLDYSSSKKFHLIYFDAFAPAAQPELWTIEVFKQLYAMTIEGGTLVTYCAKGDVRRAMKHAGFEVEKLKGPPGKREMLRATRL
jgi:tRNA U34 5-methylaminomethyl-2-thiouridine-forming methyltransferase MnmC